MTARRPGGNPARPLPLLHQKGEPERKSGNHGSLLVHLHSSYVDENEDGIIMRQHCMRNVDLNQKMTVDINGRGKDGPDQILLYNRSHPLSELCRGHTNGIGGEQRRKQRTS
jgi:hypothetical protein